MSSGRVRYLWPMRVPILSGLFLILLPWLSFWPSMRPFLSGLFDPIDNRALLLITALALFNAWTIAIITALIVTYGSVRLDLPEIGVELFPVKRRIWIGSSLLALPVIIVTVWYADGVSDGGRLAGLLAFAAAGAGVAMSRCRPESGARRDCATASPRDGRWFRPCASIDCMVRLLRIRRGGRR